MPAWLPSPSDKGFTSFFLLPNFSPSISFQTKGCLMDQLPAIPHFSTRGKLLSSHGLLEVLCPSSRQKVQDLPWLDATKKPFPCVNSQSDTDITHTSSVKGLQPYAHPKLIKDELGVPKISLPSSCSCTPGTLIPLSLYLKGESLEVDVLQIQLDGSSVEVGISAVTWGILRVLGHVLQEATQALSVRSDGWIWDLSPQFCKNAMLSHSLRHTDAPAPFPCTQLKSTAHRCKSRDLSWLQCFYFSREWKSSLSRRSSRGSWGTEFQQCFPAGDNFPCFA